ncbi:MAG: hypothetical protein ABW154_13785 [Dyella sp.]
MLAQYVHPSNLGLFRIVQHGRRWRVLLNEREVGRYESDLDALTTTRQTLPQARLPRRLQDWRYLPESALAHSRLSIVAPPPSWQSTQQVA